LAIRIKFIGMAIIICSLLAACETNKGNIPRNQDIETDDISILTGKPGGIKLLEFGSKNAPSHSIPVNALLWRAALDVASFVPIDDVDTFGGSIVTEWYQSPNRPDQRLKLTFFVLGLELRSDAVKVQTYIQKKVGNDWVDSGRDEALARKLEDLILTRARELRAVSVSETMQ